jgi:hypothetical protein
MRHLVIPLILAGLIAAPLLAEDGHAAAKPVAEKAMGAWKVAVFIPKPAIAGKALDVDLALTPAATRPKAVRLWVGAENAKGSVKVKAEPEAPGAYCVGVEVPDPIPAEAKLWLAIEAEDGTTVKESVALPAK